MLENNIFVAFESHWASAVPEKRLFVGTPHVEPTQGWQRKCKKKKERKESNFKATTGRIFFTLEFY